MKTFVLLLTFAPGLSPSLDVPPAPPADVQEATDAAPPTRSTPLIEEVRDAASASDLLAVSDRIFAEAQDTLRYGRRIAILRTRRDFYQELNVELGLEIEHASAERTALEEELERERAAVRGADVSDLDREQELLLVDDLYVARIAALQELEDLALDRRAAVVYELGRAERELARLQRRLDIHQRGRVAVERARRASR